MVIVLDDLQWAEHSSLLLLRQLAATEHSMRVLILGASRGQPVVALTPPSWHVGGVAPRKRRFPH